MAGLKPSGGVEQAMGVAAFGSLSAVPAAALKLVADALAALRSRLSGQRGRPVRDVRAECDRYSRDLERLSAQHTRLSATEGVGTAAKLRAIQRAYDDTLREACRALELEVPPESLGSVERLQVEADLVVRGLRW